MDGVVAPRRVSLERQTPVGSSEGRRDPVRIARFSIDGNVAFGAVEGDKPDELVLDIIKGIPFTEFELSGTKVPLNKVRLLPPVLPSKVVAFGRNYAEHVRELGNEVPDAPFAFFKPSTSVIGPGDEI